LRFSLGEKQQNMSGKLSLLVFRSGELLSYSAGVLLAGFFVVQLAQGEVQRQDGIAEFEQMAQASAAAQGNEQAGATAADAQDFENTGEPDTSLWAPGRLADYQASLKADLPPVLGVLEVPSVGLKVPVYSTNTELVMDRGAGIIDGMAYPHEPGNIGISGHRDGYFRVLKDVQVGDTIVLQSLEGEKHFKINATKVVAISDTTLLRDTDDQTVTLVTCYPFYFVGHAPKRFIVTASLDTPDVNQN
jgi:LPXTG-site transpeptidase (sortase) family protein